MRRMRNNKIVATLGPASATEAMIESLFLAGADIFRLNFSHGSHADHKARFDMIRRIEAKHNRPIGILQDLQGPKLRVATFASGKVNLTTGQDFRLDLDTATPGDAQRVGMPHPEIFAAIKPETLLLLDDGKMRLRVKRCGADFAETEVLVNGELSDRKGVNVPEVVLPLSAMTDKDRKDLAFGLEIGVDWVALSFVQRPEDIDEARAIIGDRARIVAKLEKPSAIASLYEIIDRTDAVMVARGDLGVEMLPEDVPPLQKRIVRACRYAGKPVIVATQMLDSMIKAPAPTRAEASDVATAIYDGADAVMLSAESASGDYPIESVAMMDRIIKRVEADDLYRSILHATQPKIDPTAADAISEAASRAAAAVHAAAIVTYTVSGSTAFQAAQKRPDMPILGLTPLAKTARHLALAWGVHPVVTDNAENLGIMVKTACRHAMQEHFAKEGDQIAITAGVPFGTPGTTNVLRLAVVS
jgi:pyruvate kinase